MRYFKSLFIIALSAITIAACSNKSNKESSAAEQDSTAYDAGNQQQDQMDNTILDAAAGNPDLSTLAKAVKAADRTNMLKEEGPYTVFAPTNEAFDALPEGTLDNLMKQENMDTLRDILAYHVVEGTVMAADLEDGQTITSVEGATLKVTKQNGNVMINGAKVVTPNVEASNGVVHVIDKVLMPPKN